MLSSKERLQFKNKKEQNFKIPILNLDSLDFLHNFCDPRNNRSFQIKWTDLCFTGAQLGVSESVDGCLPFKAIEKVIKAIAGTCRCFWDNKVNVQKSSFLTVLCIHQTKCKWQSNLESTQNYFYHSDFNYKFNSTWPSNSPCFLSLKFSHYSIQLQYANWYGIKIETP